MLQPGRPPPSLAFFLSLLAFLCCLEGVARTEGKNWTTKGPGDGGAAETTGHFVGRLLECEWPGFRKSRVVVLQEG